MSTTYGSERGEEDWEVTLKELLANPPEQYSAAIKPIEQAWSEKSLNDKAIIMHRIQGLKVLLDDRLKIVNTLFDMMRIFLIPEQMDAEGVKNSTLMMPDGSVKRLGLTPDIYASIPPENKDVAYDWFRENGYENAIIETIPNPTLKSVLKGVIKEGKDLPTILLSEPDENGVLPEVPVFKVTPYQRASLTTVKEK
jgi:hypothetical protein